MVDVNIDRATWVSGYESLREATPEGGETWVMRAEYSLGGLVEKGILAAEAVEDFTGLTGLGDVGWRALWAAGEGREAARLEELAAGTGGVVVFLHGWDGSGEIWEDLPGLVLGANPGLLALVPDVNGFGGTPFVTDTPEFEQCSPPALMHAIERWLGLLGLRDAAQARPFTLVGHSMGGAALFFLNDDDWGPHEVGRVAAAPALLLRDSLRQSFYKALGAGIMLSAWSDVVDWLQENFFAPQIIEALVGWASDFVKEEHERVFRSTPEGVTARTFAAMGRLEATFDKDRWRYFRVILAHRDRLVGLQESMELLEELNFEPHQLRVCLGDHYFFSIGTAQPKLHATNRDMLKESILRMHERLERRLAGEV